MKKTILSILLILISCTFTVSDEQIIVASWNIRILSDGSRDDSELQQIAMIMKRYDLIAIQEARDTRVLDRLKNILDGYDYVASSPVGRGVKEIYAFFYKTSKFAVLGQPCLFNDGNDYFIREPYIASFRSGNFDFTLITIHVLYGNSASERREEIKLLDDIIRIVDEKNGDENDVILCGDFNFHSDDHGWEITTHSAIVPASIKTTITDTSSYDNFWIDTDVTKELQMNTLEVYAFDELVFNDDDKTASLHVSDHRPISVIFRTDLIDDDLSGIYANICADSKIAASSTSVSEIQDVRIYSVTASPTESEQVVLKNYGNQSADISGWIIGDRNNPFAYTIPQNTVIESNRTMIFSRSTLGFGINNSGEIIFLFSDDGIEVDTWEN